MEGEGKDNFHSSRSAARVDRELKRALRPTRPRGENKVSNAFPTLGRKEEGNYQSGSDQISKRDRSRVARILKGAHGRKNNRSSKRHFRNLPAASHAPDDHQRLPDRLRRRKLDPGRYRNEHRRKSPDT